MKDITKQTTKKKATKKVATKVKAPVKKRTKAVKAVDVTILKSEKKPKPKKDKRVFKGKVLKNTKKRIVSHKVYIGSFFATEA